MVIHLVFIFICLYFVLRTCAFCHGVCLCVILCFCMQLSLHQKDCLIFIFAEQLDIQT